MDHRTGMLKDATVNYGDDINFLLQRAFFSFSNSGPGPQQQQQMPQYQQPQYQQNSYDPQQQQHQQQYGQYQQQGPYYQQQPYQNGQYQNQYQNQNPRRGGVSDFTNPFNTYCCYPSISLGASYVMLTFFLFTQMGTGLALGGGLLGGLILGGTSSREYHDTEAATLVRNLKLVYSSLMLQILK